MRVRLSAAIFLICASLAAQTVITDRRSYNCGSAVEARLGAAFDGQAEIRYAGEERSSIPAVSIRGTEYQKLWDIPWDARTGRYEIDLVSKSGKREKTAGSFVVYRQLAHVVQLDLDKTFYTSGDPVNPTVVVQNSSNKALDHLLVEFRAWGFPWIAALPDEPPGWRTVIADDLALAPGESRSFTTKKAAVVQAGDKPVVIYFSVVVRDSRNLDTIYDLAFAPPAFTSPPGKTEPKAYPALYLYRHEADVSKSEAYRRFYPPEFVSGVIQFDTKHTMFAEGAKPEVLFTLKGQGRDTVERVTDSGGKVVFEGKAHSSEETPTKIDLPALKPGLYTTEVTARAEGTALEARNRLEFAVNKLPHSLLIFCGHEDDDTAHPGLIRAAIENGIPVHIVYITGGDGGACERFYMHSCDPARGMDFGEVRMAESRGSLGHLGVSPENIFYFGLPDGGSEQIWYDHRSENNPYHSVMLASENAPYGNLVRPNMPFARDAVVREVRAMIERFHPDMIVTGHPDERHVDHRVNNWFVVEAMQQLWKEGKLDRATQLVVDVAYGPVPGAHAPYRYRPFKLWVSGEAARLGQEALWYYQSQDGNHEQANILTMDKLAREEPYSHFEILDWTEHAGWNERHQ